MAHSIGSQNEPLFWPSRGLQVYMLNGFWFVNNPQSQWKIGWVQGSGTFNEDAWEAYNTFEMIPFSTEGVK